MVQLIKKGGLRERANRSRKYADSENKMTTLDPHRYIVNDQTHTENHQPQQIEENHVVQINSNNENTEAKNKH